MTRFNFDNTSRKGASKLATNQNTGKPVPHSSTLKSTPFVPALEEFKIRSEAESADVDRVRAIVDATKFFQPAEVAIAVELVEERLAKKTQSGYEFVLADYDERLAGYICFGEIPCTVGSYDIYWIVVAPAFQRQGLGQALLQHAEQRIAQGHGRNIYIDTSGSSKYAPTRGFYARCGYTPVACLPDFYAGGDSKIIYSKTL